MSKVTLYHVAVEESGAEILETEATETFGSFTLPGDRSSLYLHEVRKIDVRWHGFGRTKQEALELAINRLAGLMQRNIEEHQDLAARLKAVAQLGMEEMKK